MHLNLPLTNSVGTLNKGIQEQLFEVSSNKLSPYHRNEFSCGTILDMLLGVNQIKSQNTSVALSINTMAIS